LVTVTRSPPTALVASQSGWKAAIAAVTVSDASGDVPELSPGESLPHDATRRLVERARTVAGQRSDDGRDSGRVMEVPYQ
jgi:hypothetical protein